MYPSQLPCEAEPVSMALQVDEEQSVGDQLPAGGRISCANPSPQGIGKINFKPLFKVSGKEQTPPKSLKWAQGQTVNEEASVEKTLWGFNERGGICGL